MAEARGGVAERQELVDVIRQVRRRWRARLLLRGAIAVIGGGLVALALASWGLQIARFSPTSVIGLRALVIVVFAALVGLWLIRPMRKRATDLQVALYIEEHEPSLQAAILSAVDAGATSATAPAGVSSVILERLIAQAVEKCRQSDAVRDVGRVAVRRHTVVLGTLVAIAVLLLAVGPEFFRQGASALLVLSRDAQAASPYAIVVEPGTVTIPKGADQIVRARLSGFRSIDVSVFTKAAGQREFERSPLVAGTTADAFEGMLFDVASDIEYYVEADGVRSSTYSMRVVELPAVETLELEYVFPAYTGLEPQKVEYGGDVAAVKGTRVRVRITPTMASPAGRLQLEPGEPAALTVEADGTLAGEFTIGQDGYYHVELDGAGGERVAASPKYTIDVLDDGEPSVSFERPRRDVRANALEEVVLQARASDDYGVRQLDLVYTVNGGDEKTVTLHRRGSKALTEVSVGHTVYLEELGVQPGDFVSYFARATDTDTVEGPKVATSDIYFIEVRPFSQDFRRAQSMAGGGGGGGGGGAGMGDDARALSEQQRQIVSATFNLERDRTKLAADKFKEDAVFVGLSQGRLREQVDELVNQMVQRLGGASENLRKIAELLPKASAEMKGAEARLAQLQTKDALAAEQRALKFLQEAEQLYDLEVQQGSGGGGGGGGGGGASGASELADMFQLELDRMANQYEMQQSAQQQSAQEGVDELANRLRELARRQLEQAEQAARQRGQQGASGSSSASQRALADEVERAARQLEQLRREAEQRGEQRQDLTDAARRLQESANTMRQAAATGSDGGAQARQAAEGLQQAQRLLDQSRTERAQQGAEQAVRRADDLARRQREIAAGVQGLNQQQGDERQRRMSELSDDKDELRRGVQELEQQLDRLGRQALAGGQRDAARRFQEAAGSVRGQSIKELIDYSKQTMASAPSMSPQVEDRLSSNMESLRERVGQAAEAARNAERGSGLNRAAQQATNLTRGINTLQEQMRQRAEQQGQEQAGQAPGGEGQQGQDQQGTGQQGQGQQGGRGQQGQQGEGQGQQGQAGQGGQQPGQTAGQQAGTGRAGGGQQRLDGSGTLGGAPNQARGGDARAGFGGYGYDDRQLRNQAGQLAADAQQLRRQLQDAGASRQDLQAVDEVLRMLQNVTSELGVGTAAGLQQLSAAALDRMQKLEFDLRQRTDTTSDQLYLAGADTAPARYRSLVDEYFRELSQRK